jgi:hypothetical protein
MPEITTHLGNLAQSTTKITERTHDKTIIPTIVPEALAKADPIPFCE